MTRAAVIPCTRASPVWQIVEGCGSFKSRDLSGRIAFDVAYEHFHFNRNTTTSATVAATLADLGFY